VATAPAKPSSATRTALALQADAVFWQTLHAGRYEDIGRALELKTAAYLENPGDALTAAHAGWLHIWRLAESGRLAQVPATITNDAVTAATERGALPGFPGFGTAGRRLHPPR